MRPSSDCRLPMLEAQSHLCMPFAPSRQRIISENHLRASSQRIIPDTERVHPLSEGSVRMNSEAAGRSSRTELRHAVGER